MRAIGQKYSFAAAAALALCCFSGCGIHVREAGNTTVYSNHWWFPLIFAVVSVVLSVIGWMIQRNSDEDGFDARAWGLILVGPVLLIGAIPAMLLNRVSVTPEEVHIKDSFFWFFPNGIDVRFADLSSIREDERMSGGKRRRMKYFLVFTKRDGSTTEVLKESLVNHAKEKIFEHARNAGVAINGESPQTSPVQGLATTDTQSGDKVAARPNSSKATARPTAAGSGQVSPAMVGVPVTAEMQLAPSTPIQAHWGSTYWYAEVVAVQPNGDVKVHYLGWSANFDEVLPRAKLRIEADIAAKLQAGK